MPVLRGRIADWTTETVFARKYGTAISGVRREIVRGNCVCVRTRFWFV
jgi:hypothetical protein